VSGTGAAAPIRVLVADDQAIVRDGISTVLSLEPDIEVVGEAADGEEAVRRVVALQPDVVLMDLRMPVLDGAGATERLRDDAPGTAVLVLTTYADDASIMGALRAGARGYLTKDAGRAELAAAIRAVHSGQTTLAAEVGARLIGGLSAPDALRQAQGSGDPDPLGRFPDLTARERDVLELIADGLANPEIAARLFVSTATVKTHVNAIFAKLGTRTRAETIALVHRP
jgi:DNA-binding NarL/FixJ family response regulator